MSRQNVEIVRAHIEAFRAEDTERSASFCDPHIVWEVSRLGIPELSTATYGIEAIVQGVVRWVGAFEGYDYEVESLADLGSGQVLAVITEVGRGKGSGAPVGRSYAVLYTVIASKIVRITAFSSAEEAREAVGAWE